MLKSQCPPPPPPTKEKVQGGTSLDMTSSSRWDSKWRDPLHLPTSGRNQRNGGTCQLSPSKVINGRLRAQWGLFQAETEGCLGTSSGTVKTPCGLCVNKSKPYCLASRGPEREVRWWSRLSPPLAICPCKREGHLSWPRLCSSGESPTGLSFFSSPSQQTYTAPSLL